MSKPIVFGVCGSSCSGKTTACKRIEAFIHKMHGEFGVTVLSQDRYYIGRGDKANYDELAAIEWSLLIAHLLQLMDGKSIDAPIYDFSTHSRRKETERINPARIIIVEGIMIFAWEELANLMNLKIFVSARSEVCFARRLDRDTKERGRTMEEVTERYLRDVVPSNTTIVEPSMWRADIVLMNNVRGVFIGIDVLLPYVEKILSLQE